MSRKLLVICLVIFLPPLIEASLGCGVQFTACDDCEERPPELSFPNSYMCSCSCTPDGRSEQSNVVAVEDDAKEFTNGVMSLNLPTLTFAADGAPVGVRFQNVMIPAGAVITSAVVEFTAAASDMVAVEFAIRGEASANAAAFTTALNDISSRPLVAGSVPSWIPGAWVNGTPAQTPDLSAILQDIIDQLGWTEGNALVLTIQSVSGLGQRRAHSYDGSPPMAPVLRVAYQDAAPIVDQAFRVCAPAGDNQNLGGGGLDPTVDCGGRVETTLEGLAGACSYPTACNCGVVADSAEFADVCDDPCTETPLAPGCSNFDPVGNLTDATNAVGDTPVCLSGSPLSFGVFGRRTACTVAGQALVQIDDEAALPNAGGVVQFRGDPCPGGGCTVAMEYDLDIADVTFSNAFDSETFTDLSGVGGSISGGDVTLDPNGDGTFGSEDVKVSARGVREGEQKALIAFSDDVIGVNASFGSVGPMCSLAGSLLGSVDPELKRCENAGPDADKVCSGDGDCADDPGCSDGTCNCQTVSNADLSLSIIAGGPITNQPPFADAGLDQIVECPAFPVLDGSASSDLDSNIVLYSWFLGDRVGPEVGHRPMEQVAQGLGIESYVLRVIDEKSQADEDVTMVTVEDTTPPELECAVAVSEIREFNHNLHNVGLTGSARDACEGVLPVMVSVYGDEDDEMPTGDGTHAPDAASIDLETLRLRGERRGDADGRVYLIVAEATDFSGNRGFDCCSVAVPHSKNKKAGPAVQAQAAAARAFCLANGAAPANYFLLGDGPVIGPKQ